MHKSCTTPDCAARNPDDTLPRDRAATAEAAAALDPSRAVMLLRILTRDLIEVQRVARYAGACKEHTLQSAMLRDVDGLLEGALWRIRQALAGGGPS